MKAVIMAGGEGSRLRPITCGVPKPMVKMLGKPVMEHIIELLKANDICDIAATLMYCPESVTSYFGEGEDLGVNIEYFIEETPLGTAGSVGNCRDFLNGGDFLVISGDAVCDFDLKSLIAFHNAKKADLTIATYSHPEPLEYGVVLSDEEGRIYGFVEKPGWDQVFSNQVNTGIYVVSGKLLSKIPKNRSFDFSKDLFPLLLREKAGLYACPLEGYWCDMGDTAAYLSSALDMLSGRVKSVKPPEDALHIGRGVKLGADIKLQNSILEEGAVIGDGANIKSSIVAGTVGAGASLSGAIVCAGALIGAGASLGEGSVIGSGAYIGRGSVIGDGVRVWPGKKVADGARAVADITSGAAFRTGVMEDGAITEAFEEPDVSFFLNLGAALATVFGGRIGLSFSEGEMAGLFADCLSAGIRSCGSDVVATDAKFAALAAWSAKPLRLSIALHVDQSGSIIKTSIFDKNGLPLERADSRKLQSLISKGEINRVNAIMTGKIIGVNGLMELYSQELAGELSGMVFAVTGEDPAAKALRKTLLASGAKLTEGGDYFARLEPMQDGTGFEAADTLGRRYSPGHVACLAAMCLFMEGKKQIGVPYTAPAAMDALAARYEARVFRLGRDSEAQALYVSEPVFRDACSAASLIFTMLRQKGIELSEAMDSLPGFELRSREIECGGEGGKIMKTLADSLTGVNKELCRGLKVCLDGSWVHVTPVSAGRLIKIRAEGMDMEAAEEICLNFYERVREAGAKTAGNPKNQGA